MYAYNVQAGERERKIKLTNKQTNKQKERKITAGSKKRQPILMNKSYFKMLITFGSSFPVSPGASVHIFPLFSDTIAS